MTTSEKLSVRELLLEQWLDQHHPHSKGHQLLEEFKKSLRTLALDYEVLVITPNLPAIRLSGRPMQLWVTPHSISAASLQIRVSGTLVATDATCTRFDFKPVSVDISRTQAAPLRSEFLAEAESAHDLIAHVHHVLRVLRHEDQSTLVLSA